jgi:hypothetical protein
MRTGNNYFQIAISRLHKIADTKFSNLSIERDGSAILLMKEYFKRMALWSDILKQDYRIPFFDVTKIIDSSISLDEEQDVIHSAKSPITGSNG